MVRGMGCFDTSKTTRQNPSPSKAKSYIKNLNSHCHRKAIYSYKQWMFQYMSNPCQHLPKDFNPIFPFHDVLCENSTTLTPTPRHRKQNPKLKTVTPCPYHQRKVIHGYRHEMLHHMPNLRTSGVKKKKKDNPLQV